MLGPIKMVIMPRLVPSVVLHDVPEHTTVVGVPGRVVVYAGKRVPSIDLNHVDLPDPVAEMMRSLQRQIDELRVKQEELLRRKRMAIRVYKLSDT